MWRLGLHALTALLIMVLAAGLAGCGGGSGESADAPPPAAAAPTLSSDGGTVSGTEGVTVIVPPGALSAPTTVRVAIDSSGAPPVPSWFEPVGPMLAITPHGAAFSEAVTVRLPRPDVTLADNERLLIAKAQPGGEWTVLGDTALSDGQLEAQVRSFSVFAVVRVRYETTLQPAVLQTPFAMGAMTLACDGRPCAEVERIRAMAITATTSGNGGALPAGCSAPTVDFATAIGGSYSYGVLNDDSSLPIDSPSAFQRTFPMPTAEVLQYRAFGLAVQASLICTDPTTRAKSTLTGATAVLRLDEFATSPTLPVVREWPTVLSAAPGDALTLRLVMSGGGSYMTGPGTFAAPSPLNPVGVHFERQRAGELLWTRLLSAPQSMFDASPYGGPPWMYWGGDIPLASVLGPSGVTSADNGAAFRVRACFGSSSAPSDCMVGPAARLTVVQRAQAPVFTAQPRSVLIQPGQTASFSARVGGAPTPTLQWQTRSAAPGSIWINVAASGNTANYTTPALALSDSGVQYRLLATNSAGSVASDVAIVSVNAAGVAPTITTQPTSISVVRGSEAVFAVHATGTEALSYQWQRGSRAIAGANAPQFKLSGVSDADRGAYVVRVSNAAGAVTSAPAQLTVTTAPAAAVAPTIATQPAAVAVSEGNVATFAVGVNGSGPLAFQWRRNGVDIAGANAAAYTIAAVALADAGNYSVRITNSAGSVVSQAATLAVAPATTSVIEAPTIVTPPGSIVVAPGMSAMFGVGVQGSGPLSFQWQRNGQPVPGQTLATYSIAAASALDAGSYRVQVSNSAGSVLSPPSQVILLGAPAISVQPSAASASEGASATFSVAASGDHLRYQWLRNHVGIAGADAASYTTPALALADAGAVYSVIVYNGAGLVFSQPALLTVTVAAPSAASQARKVAAAFRHTCAISSDDRAMCWGYNSSGQLGSGDGNDRWTPFAPSLPEGARAVATGHTGSCAIGASGVLYCWGGVMTSLTGQPWPRPTPVPGFADVRDVAVGDGFACLLRDQGTVWCWGNNSVSQLGNDSTTGSGTPVQVLAEGGAPLADVRAVSAGANHACALRSDQRVLCWGHNLYGQAGQSSGGTAVARVVPDLLAIEVMAGGAHTCARRSEDQAVLCWGLNLLGQLGQGTTSPMSVPNPTPLVVSGLAGAVALGRGDNHSCAVMADGSVRCWGTGPNGSDIGGSAMLTPRTIPALSGAVAVASGFEHSCALRSNGSMACWGGNGAGQLGLGDFVTRTNVTALPGFTFAVP